MSRYILDTGPAQDFIQRVNPVYDRTKAAMAAGHRIGVGLPTVGELFAGAEYSNTRSRNLTRLRHNLLDLSLWPLDKKAAQEFGRLYALLRRIGRPMQQIDIQIAAIALTLRNCTVVTKDSDFAAIPGLSIEDWS